MKFLVIMLLAAMILLSASAFAEEAKPKVEVPLYPGAEATLELGLAGSDVVPTLNAMLPMLAMGMSKGADLLDADTISGIFRDVTRIDVLTLTASKAKDTELSVADFYSKKLPTGSWAKVFSTKDAANGTIRVYSKSAGDGLYAFRVRRLVENGKIANKAEIAKIEGKMDYLRLIDLFMKFSAMGQPKAGSQPASPSE